MIRAATLLLCLTLPVAALAQDTAPPAEDTGASDDVKRVRADFRARFVDYDEKLKALGRRIEALEAQLGTKADEAVGLTPADSSAATMPPDGAGEGDEGADGEAAESTTPAAQ